MKPPLLFLCHRIPYPPNKGDKIRSFHLLRHLSQHFEIFLGSFVDDPADWTYAEEVEKLCSESLLVELKPWRAKLHSLTGLATGDALSVPFYSNKQLQAWVDDCIATHDIKHVIAYSSPMAQFVLEKKDGFDRMVVDFVDVDSDKWQQYAEQKSWPKSWVYRREARHLFEYEQTLAESFDAGLFVSSHEAELFRQLSPDSSASIGYYNNGVNAEYFNPSADHKNPYPEGERTIVFTGAMDYWPNIDAVVWFVRQVMPAIRASLPDLNFYIVGSNPSAAVKQLANEAGVVVTGRVEDVRPYLQHALAAVAPMRIARGVQNKVLEAMAMACPVLVSSKGLEGIAADHGVELLIADSVDQYVALLKKLYCDEFDSIGIRARACVIRHFNWDESLPEVVLLLKGSVPVQDGTASVRHA